jgi:hypothetical protein
MRLRYIGQAIGGRALGRAVGVLGLSSALVACVASRPEAPLSPCDTITGTATNYGRAYTTRLAEQSFRTQAPTIRGELVASGVRRVRVVAQRKSCVPYGVFGGSAGLVTCRVQARVCGR